MSSAHEIRLGDIAHARSGDKGSGANIAVFARDEKHYTHLIKHLTPDRVESFFQSMGVGVVRRYEVPSLAGLNFVLPRILAGGGSRSLRIDAQGKTLAMIMLEMKIAAPD